MLRENKITILTLAFAISTTTITLANSYDISNNNEVHNIEKVKIKDISDYYDYLEEVGALKEENKIGPDANIVNEDNTNISNGFKHFTAFNTAVAKDMENNETNGELVTDGYKTKFSYTDKYGMKQYLKGWFALSLATGQKGWYHFDDEGNMSIGLYKDKKGNTYYLIEDGINKGMMATGQINIGGKLYHFSDEIGPSYGKMINQ